MIAAWIFALSAYRVVTYLRRHGSA